MSPGNVCYFGEGNILQTQTGMVSTSSLSRSEDTSPSMFRDGLTLRYPTETEFTSISDSVNSKFTGVLVNRFQGDVNSISKQSVSSGSSRGKKEGNKVRAVGRGGIGNIINTETLEVDYVDEADILRRRRLLAQFNPRAKISNTGRGGTGNILAASGSVPYDPSKDPDDEYEKIVQVEAQKKRMQQASSTGRGGSGNVRSISTDTRPRSKSLGMFKRKKSRTDLVLSRPSTASTIASNASSDHHELREYTLASSVWGPPKPTFDTHTSRNAMPIIPATIPPTPSLSVGSSQADQTDTTRLLQRLAVSSAPPPQPVWRLQYPKQEPDTKHSRRKERMMDKEKKETKGKWWKKSTKKSDNEEYHSVEPSIEHDLERSEPRQRRPPLVTDPNPGREEFHLHSTSNSISGRVDTTTISSIPRIPMRNPLIPSHVDQGPETTTERSLSPVETQILDEIRILAESKMHRDGHFDMSGLEEVLMQARHRHHQMTPVDSNSLPQSPPRAKRAPDTKTSSNHEHFKGCTEHQNHRLGERIEYSHHPSTTAQEIQAYHVSPSPFSNPTSSCPLSSSVSDVDTSDYGPAALSGRDAPSISGKSLKIGRRERQVYQHQELPIIPHMQNGNLKEQRSDAALGHPDGIKKTPRQSETYFDIPRRQLTMEGDEERQGGMGKEEEDWCLHPVTEEEDIYLIEDEEPYTSFIDI